MNRSGTQSATQNITTARASRRHRNLIAISGAAAAVTAIMLSAPTARATNDAWSTTPASGNFSGINWTLGTTTPGAPTGTASSTDSLFFGTSTTTSLTNDDSAFAFAGLTFNSGASAFTITGNSFALTGAITNNSTSLETISTPITVAAAQSINPFAGGITLGGTVTDSAALTITGPNAVTFSGTGDSLTGLTLGVAQTNTNGSSNAAAANAVGVTANLNNSASIGPVLVATGGNVVNVGAGAAVTSTTLGLANPSDRATILNINLGAGSSFATNATNTNGVLTIGSQFNLLTLNGSDFAANSTNVAGGTLAPATYTTLAATGNLAAQNSNVTGNVAITGSASMNTLRFDPSVASTVTITAGQTLSLNGPGGGGGSVLMPATSGAVTDTITGGSLLGSSNRGTAILNYDTTSGSNLQINSSLNNYIASGSGASGTAVVVVAGGGTVTLGGANFINGSLFVDKSTLSVGSDSNLGAVNGTVSVTTATNGSTSVTLTSANTNTSGLATGDILLGQIITAISSNGVGTTVTLGSAYTGTSITTPTTVGYVGGGAIDFNGATLLATSNFSLGETNNTGSVSTGLSTTIRNRSIGLGLKGATIDVTGGNTLTIPGVISSSTGATATIGALNKIDSGVLAIAGSAANTGLVLNNIAGTTTLGNTSGVAANIVNITGGTVQIATGTPNVSQVNAVNVNGGVFDLNGFSGLISSITTINGTAGTITNSSSTANATLFIGQGGGVYTDSLTIASNIVNGSTKLINVNDQGGATSTRTVTLSGNDSYTGTTTVGGGTLTIDASTNASASLSGTSSVTVGPAATLKLISPSSATSVDLINDSASVFVSTTTTSSTINLALNGLSETIGNFYINNVAQGPGTYNFANDPTYFSSSSNGSLVVPAPEPAVMGMMGLISGVSLLRRRRRSKQA